MMKRDYVIYAGVAVLGALVLTPDSFAAEVTDVNAAITGIANSLLPNFKFGTSVVSGGLGLGLLVAGLLKTSPRLLISGGCLAIVPAAIFSSVVGNTVTMLIP
jgi:hypothetical protein